MRTVYLLSVLVVLCTVAGVISQSGLLAGAAQESFKLIGSTRNSPPQRFLQIPQTDEKEWENLGSTFTLELWVWMDPPPSNADGNWTQQPDEMQFWSIVSRHPGQNFDNEWSHFNLQITRTSRGPAVVFWAGCGCTNDMHLEQSADDTCGFAYLLASDRSSIPAQDRFYLRPLEWHHIAVTVDGDSLTSGFTSGVGRLYIDGKEIYHNVYADKLNNPPYRVDEPVCQGRPIFSETVPGTQNNKIFVGWYNNQDYFPNSYPANPSYIFGFFGMIDELRIWSRALSPREIYDNYDVVLDPDSEDDLEAIYNFNDPIDDHSFPNEASPDQVPIATVEGPQNQGPPNEPNNGLMISQKVIVQASDGIHEDIPNPFALIGESEMGYFITSFSELWAESIMMGDAEIFDSAGNMIAPDVLPFEVNLDELTVFFYCNGSDCSNIPGNFREIWFSYASLEVPSVQSLVYFDIQPVCFAGFDDCGVCGGDNRTCQCVIYHDFRNTRMAYILLTWSLERIIEKIDKTVKILNEIYYIVEDPTFDNEILEGNYTLAHEVSYMMDFYNLCLTDYCADVTEFIAMLDEYLVSLLPNNDMVQGKRSTSTFKPDVISQPFTQTFV